MPWKGWPGGESQYSGIAQRTERLDRGWDGASTCY